jgi:hypothetical protein
MAIIRVGQPTPSNVILGAGIIELSTAYHLALAQNEALEQNPPGCSNSIIVVDPSSAVCKGASGQCEGALGAFGFPPETEPLAKLSYTLYSDLAAVQGSRFGYSPLIVHAVSPTNTILPTPASRSLLRVCIFHLDRCPVPAHEALLRMQCRNRLISPLRTRRYLQITFVGKSAAIMAGRPH